MGVIKKNLQNKLQYLWTLNYLHLQTHTLLLIQRYHHFIMQITVHLEKVRIFVEKKIMPYVDRWDRKGIIPDKRQLRLIAYKEGIYGALWPKEYGGTPPKNLDIFHDVIWHDELARCSAGGVLAGIFLPNGWALSPVLEHGSRYLIDKCARRLITGEKSCALCITEPSVGSDVGQLKCFAKCFKQDYLLNGEKIYISNGMDADYLTVASRTGGKGQRGISLFLVDRMESSGIITSSLKTMGWRGSGTAVIIFKNVRVPSINIIGHENQGFKPIVSNFNHGRFVHSITGIRYSRVCLEESLKYSRKRKTFGKLLIEHPIIRAKPAEMTRRIESTSNWLDILSFSWEKKWTTREVSGPMALLKVQTSQTMEFCSREALQIFGGKGYIQGGRGSKI